jgi:hypothetical protein
VQAPYGHHCARGRRGREGRLPVTTLAQGAHECGDLGLGDVAQVGATGRREMAGIAGEIPPVRQQAVGGEATLDRQVVEVAADLALRRRGLAQASTSARARTGMP